jgi:hypothetical protein
VHKRPLLVVIACVRVMFAGSMVMVRTIMRRKRRRGIGGE